MKKKKKILYICESIGGGVRKHLVDVLHNLNESKYEIVVVHSQIRTDELFREEIEPLQRKGIEFISLPQLVREISLFNDLKSIAALVQIIRERKPDVVHCHSSKAGGVGRIASYICRTRKIIYTPHAYMFQNTELSQLKRLVFLFFERFLDSFSTFTINVSEGERETALKHKVTTTTKSILIHNGIQSAPRQLSPPDDALIVGTTARLEAQKDPWTFFSIAKNVVRQNERVKFVYVGDGSMKQEIQDAINKEGLQDRIILTGFQKDPLVYLQTFHIYLITSLYEGMPYSVLEALSYGLPLVATNVIGNNEVVEDGYNGFLFNMKSVNEGVEKIQLLLNNREMAVRFGLNSRLLFESKFGIDKMIKLIEQIYDDEERYTLIQAVPESTINH